MNLCLLTVSSKLEWSKVTTNSLDSVLWLSSAKTAAVSPQAITTRRGNINHLTAIIATLLQKTKYLQRHCFGWAREETRVTGILLKKGCRLEKERDIHGSHTRDWKARVLCKINYSHFMWLKIHVDNFDWKSSVIGF